MSIQLKRAIRSMPEALSPIAPVQNMVFEH